MIEEPSSDQHQQNDAEPSKVIPVPLVDSPPSSQAQPVEQRDAEKQIASESANANSNRNIEKSKEVGKAGMSPFERKIAIVGIILGTITAVFFWIQLKEMTYQTQILASQSEGANAGGLLDEMNTRKQLAIAQQQAVISGKQAKSAQGSVKAIQSQLKLSQNQFRDQQRPWLGIKDGIALDVNVGSKDYIAWKMKSSIDNMGLIPATRVVTTFDSANKLIYRLHGTWKNSQICRQAAQLSSDPDNFPDTEAIFPGSKLAWAETIQVVPDSQYFAICIAYTDVTNRPYSTKLLYSRSNDGFRLLDSEIK